MPSMYVLYVTPEAEPLVKVGGLADVARSLPPALNSVGLRVDLAVPLYGAIRQQGRALEPLGDVPKFSLFDQTAEFYRTTIAENGVEAFLIGNNFYFDRPHPYTDTNGQGYEDNLERFVFFQRALLHLVSHLRGKGKVYDIIHANDHQSSLVPMYLRETAAGEACGKPSSVLTIHNLGYQGIYPEKSGRFMDAATVAKITGLPHWLYYATSPLEFWGRLNCLKAGIEYADGLTTVSPTYAKEIQGSEESGFGLQDVLKSNRHKLRGILNGVDPLVWNPKLDPHLSSQGAANFSVATMEGKITCKRKLFERFNFPLAQLGRPVFGMIARLVTQKGVDLAAQVLPYLAAQDAFVAILGNGPDAEMLAKVAARHPNRVGLVRQFDEPLAHLITAGSDFYLMPSKYEPCGLNQMYAMAYGTLPIVRKTGGLADTVSDITADPEHGTGFVFEPYDPDAFLGAVVRAVTMYERDRRIERARQRVMLVDLSWTRSAKEYVEFYESVRNRAAKK